MEKEREHEVGIIDVGGGGARGARAPPAVGLEILSGLKPWRKKRRKEEKEKERV